MPKLARIRGDVEQTLARIRARRAPSTVPRGSSSFRGNCARVALRVLLGQIVPDVGARTKDFVMPSTLDFKPEGRSDCFRSDGRTARCSPCAASGRSSRRPTSPPSSTCRCRST
ncbi:MAG: hypothetical protein ACLU0O_06390 [Collinsella sp.]